MHIIKTRNLTRRYQAQAVVDDLNLQVEQGQIFGLIGPNGAGKTTTVRMLTTLLNPSIGTASVNSFDIITQPRAVRQSIGYVPQESQADEALTGREHLILQGRLYGLEKAMMMRRISEMLDLVDLKKDADKRALEYSGGMRKLMNIAAGLLHMPKILFLDEPTSGVDVTHRQRILDHICNLPRQGITVFLTTHFLEEVDRIAHQVVLLDHGKIIASGAPEELKTNIGASVIDITLASLETAFTQIVADKLSELIGVTKLVADRNRLKLFTNREHNILTEIQQLLKHEQLPIAALTVAQPTLDDVFFYHIGRGVA